MASKTAFSGACLLALMVAANTFLVSEACNSCHHSTPPTPTPPTPSPPPPAPEPPTPTTPCPPPPSPGGGGGSGKCPKDTLKLGACANVLGLGIVGIGKAPSGGGKKCCSLLGGLADLEAAVCLCTALKANVLGIVLDIPIKLSLILNYCGKTAPTGFQCS